VGSSCARAARSPAANNTMVACAITSKHFGVRVIRRSLHADQRPTEVTQPNLGYARTVTAPPFAAIDHVQLAIPPDGEPAARRFYGELLGLVEVPKPPAIAARGGCWFESGAVKIHLGVEDDFRPARRAHPALLCRDYQGLLARLAGAGVAVHDAADVPGVTRCHVDDPFGNRIELIAPGTAFLSYE
jgi:catechol 2,3-dioxygenase-like lactoylglutathione lyase family enzyme